MAFYKKKCFECHKDFYVKASTAKYCNRLCRLEVNRRVTKERFSNLSEAEKERSYRKHVLKAYDLTEEMYEEMLDKQQQHCKICSRGETRVDPRTGKRAKLSVDHDHATGKVRGLLCNRCNKLLGVAEDNPIILLRAIHYLKSSR